jgi:hypothetical protein
MEKVPVLLIIHKRPAETRQVFEAIRRYRPDRLYVVADGPRLHVEGEQVLAEQARAEATAVDWPCRLITLFRIENMGCGPSVKTGIDWFFEAEEKGVILEDDCVPGPDFFQFCQTLLGFAIFGGGRLALLTRVLSTHGTGNGIFRSLTATCSPSSRQGAL